MSIESLPAFEQIFSTISAVAAVASVIAVIAYGFKSGLVRSLKVGSIYIEGGITPQQIVALESPDKDEPFEATALSNYYNHALSRANISFWFSLLFASIGFGVIIFAFATHTSGDLAGTVVKAASGTVIDIVSSLFFVQSTNAQKSMSDFFEKLRMDRLNAEARDMISEIEDSQMRDQLRAQLVLKYSAIDRMLTSDQRTA